MFRQYAFSPESRVDEHVSEKLYECSGDGSIDQVKELVKKGAKVNWKHEFNGSTPLHYAATNGHNEVVVFLFQNGAQIDMKDNDGLTPLHYAATHGHDKIAEFLFQNGTNIDTKDNNGLTPLHYAATNGHDKIVEYFLQNGAQIDAENKDKKTPFFFAQLNNKKSTEKLIQHFALFQAAAKDLTEELLALLTDNTSIHVQNSKQQTLLHIAAKHNCINNAKLLLQLDILPNAVDADGQTALHLAVENGHQKMVQVLVDGGVSINSKNKNNQTPLDIALFKHDNGIAFLLQRDQQIDFVRAVTEGDIAKTRQFIASGANPNFLGPNNNNEPLLHTCIRQGNNDVLSALLESPLIDVNCIDKDGITAIDQAILCAFDNHHVHSTIKNDPSTLHINELSMVIKLLCAKPTIDHKYKNLLKSLSDQESSYRSTFELLDGVVKNNIQCIQQLLESGADPNLSNKMGSYLMHIAAGNGYIDMLQLLLKYNAAIDVRDMNGCTPMHLASVNGHENGVELLLTAGANANVTDNNGNTPLHLAAASGSDAIVTLLLEKSHNVYHSPINEEGMTPLHLAAQNGMEKIVDLLLQIGVDVNYSSKDGYTALHLAARNGSLAVVKNLLDMNALVDIASNKGETALHCAAISGNVHAVEILLLAGANIDKPNQYGLIPEKLSTVSLICQVFLDARKKKNQGLSIITAICQGDDSCVINLLSEGTDCNTVDENGNSLLHLSVENERLDIVQLLLNQPGINRYQLKKELFFAIKLGHRNIARCIYDATQKNIVLANGDSIVIDMNNRLGYGTSGAVYKGSVNGHVVAVKKSNGGKEKELLLEIQVMERCKSPYIIQVIAVDKNESNPSLALEFMDCGNLREYLDAKRCPAGPTIDVTPLQVAWVLANALADIHRNKILHRDLKSLNVLLSTENYIKLGDFGISREVGSKMTTAKGTWYWTAPEVFKSKEDYSFPADIYSFGVILTELDTLKPPYADNKFSGIEFLHLVSNGELRPSVSSTCERWLRKLADKCLAFDPNQRPTAEEIIVILERELGRQQKNEPDGPSAMNMTAESTETSVVPNPISARAMKILSTSINCNVCQKDNPIDNDSCGYCSAVMPFLTASEKVKLLLDRVKVAKRKNIEIQAFFKCHICNTENSIEAVVCQDEDCIAELNTSSEIKLAMLIKAFTRFSMPLKLCAQKIALRLIICIFMMNHDLWEMLEDEVAGVYFRNRLTMETRWTLPVHALESYLVSPLYDEDDCNQEDNENDDGGDVMFLEKEEEEIIARWSTRASSLVYDEENRPSCPRSSAGDDQSGLNQFDSIADGGVFEQKDCVQAIYSLRAWIQRFPSLLDPSALDGKLRFPMYTRSVHQKANHEYLGISVHHNGNDFIFSGSASDTIFTLLLKSVQYFSINKGRLQPIYHSFVLKVVGRNEYLMDDTLTLEEYSYLHTCFRDKTIAKLCLLEQSEDDAKVKVNAILSRHRERTLFTDVSFNGINNSKLNTIEKSTVQWPFRVKINTLAQLKYDSRMTHAIVAVSLWTGPVTRLVSTHCSIAPPSNQPSTHELLDTKAVRITRDSCVLSWEGHNWLTFTTAYSELPSSARLAFIVYGVLPENRSQRLEEKRIALAAAWIPIEDVRGCVIGGHHQVSLWPCTMTPREFDSGVFPLGFPTSMNPKKNHGVLSYELDTFDAPLQSKYCVSLSTATPTCPSIANCDYIILQNLENVNMLHELTHHEKLVLWHTRSYSRQVPRLLLVFLRSINWGCVKAVEEARKLLLQWTCDDNTYLDCIQLLGHEFPDPVVRAWAIKQLHKLQDDTLQEYLLQLVQVLKYELHTESALARFLLFRSILNPVQLGQQLFWLLKTEVDDWLHASRYSVILATYVSLNAPHRNLLFEQCRIVDQLELIAQRVKQADKHERLLSLQQELYMLNRTITQDSSFHLCLSLQFECKSILVDKCKVMSSAKKPLWITFENADPLGEPISAIFKHGDDLRQDLLTLQQIRLMDKLWESSGLDLRLKPYQCQSIGFHLGMIEVVPNSKTTAHIHRDFGHVYFGAWMTTPIESYLKNNATDDNCISFSNAVDNFIRTCAGYCVATYVLGIGDRHCDNIMVTTSGHLFHIDFGHFLGNFKVKFGVKRERAPFVLTPEMAFVMRSSTTETRFEKFEQFCCEAYNLLRHQNALWIALFALMVPAQVPEMTDFSDITYLQQQLSLDLSNEEAAAKFKSEIKNALSSTSRRVDNWMHNMKHGISLFTS